MPTDEVEVISSHFFSDVRTRTLVDTPSVYKYPQMNNSIPKSMAMDFSRILNKPFRVGSFNWTTSNTKFTPILNLSIPSTFLNGLPCGSALRAPFEVAALYRANVKMIFQVSGTPMHQGTIILAAVPKATASNDSGGDVQARMSTYMSAPHTFLYANGSSSVNLEVPFYANTKYLYTEVKGDTISFDSHYGDYANVVGIVVNPLSPPTSGSTSLSITAYVVFESAEFYIPHSDVEFVSPSFEAQSGILTNLVDMAQSKAKEVTSDFIDSCRTVFRDYTGLHNNNNPYVPQKNLLTERNLMNTVDSNTLLEKLDPFSNFTRVVDQPIFETSQDEMLVNYVLSKPQYLGTFDVAVGTAPGKVLWSRPITPFQEVNVSAGNSVFSAPISILSLLSKYWRGGLKIHIQSNMSNFHFCKLAIARDYSPTYESITKVPKFADISNLLVSNLEFSGGGQVQTIDMPYMSIFDQLELTTDWIMNAICHGMYYVYLDQPLVTNGSVSNTVSFNVYISVNDDFQLYGYSTNLLDAKALTTPFTGVRNIDGRVFEAQSLINTSADDSALKSCQARVKQPSFVNNNFHLNSSIRDYIRRFHTTDTISRSITAENHLFAFPVSTLLGLDGSGYSSNITPLTIIQQMYRGYCGGMKFKLHARGVSDATISFVPPGMRANQNDAGSKISAVRSTISLSSGLDISLVNGWVSDSVEYMSAFPFPVTRIETATQPRSNSLPSGILELEGVVPNMSMYRFVGDMAAHNNQPTQVSSSCMDLGTLFISFPEVNIDTSAYFNLYVAASDEARLGFQVCTPHVYINAFDSVEGPKCQRTPYNSDYADPELTPWSVQPLAAPACYI